jgi:nitrite reductase/ring-hydroxylating ferredoxin subunit
MSDQSAEPHYVATESELEEGDQIVTIINGLEVSIFNIDNEYYAYANWCAHQAGPVCEGRITGTVTSTYDRETGEERRTYEKEGEVLNCPWHGWEYDIKSGECLSKNGVSLPSFPVEVNKGKIFVLI